MSDRATFAVVPGDVDASQPERRRWRAHCDTEGKWVGPVQSTYSAAYSDAEKHLSANPGHVINIVTGA